METFSDYLDMLNKRKWSIKYWDGRPTQFLPVEEYEYLVGDLLESKDLPFLNLILDEVPVDLMEAIADSVLNSKDPELLQWYVDSTYPPLIATMTAERIEPFLTDDDFGNALLNNEEKLNALYTFYRTAKRRSGIAAAMKELFALDSTKLDSTFPPAAYSLERWRQDKKERFLSDRGVNSPSPVSSIRKEY